MTPTMGKPAKTACAGMAAALALVLTLILTLGLAFWAPSGAAATADAPLASPAAPSPPALALAGSWLVTVENERETRTLVIDEATAAEDGLRLRARYGMTTLAQSAVPARVNTVDGRHQLLLTTQAGTKIAAVQQPDGAFGGSFQLKNGSVRAVRIERITGVQVDFVYMGGSDCPICRVWEAIDLPKLQSGDAFAKLRFTKMPKFIYAEVPSAFWFPSEVKHLRDPIASRLPGVGSPMFALLLNGRVILAWKGVSRSPDDLNKAFAALLAIQP